MAVSFNDLYSAQMKSLEGSTSIFKDGSMDSSIAQQKRDAVYANALADYERLNRPTGTGASTTPPTTPRSTRTPLPMPTMGGGGGATYSSAQPFTPGGGFRAGEPGSGKTGFQVMDDDGSLRNVSHADFIKTVAERTAATDAKRAAESASPAATPYNLPVYDTGKVEGLAQRFATPGIRNLRSTMQDVQQGSYDNPNVKRMTLRDALAGYGQGLESVMAGALKEGTNVYGQQYGAEVNKAGAEFGAGEARALQGTSIASQERMHGRGITSQEALQQQNLAAQRAMHSESIASQERINELNHQWQAYLASLG